jgi:hypothetical protein
MICDDYFYGTPSSKNKYFSDVITPTQVKTPKEFVTHRYMQINFYIFNFNNFLKRIKNTQNKLLFTRIDKNNYI